MGLEILETILTAIVMTATNMSKGPGRGIDAVRQKDVIRSITREWFGKYAQRVRLDADDVMERRKDIRCIDERLQKDVNRRMIMMMPIRSWETRM